MDIRPLYLKDETPQDYALRLFRSLAKCSFLDLVYTCYVDADYARGFFSHFAVLLQDQEGNIKFDRCSPELAFKYLCGDYWAAGPLRIPLAAIEIGKMHSVIDFFDDWQFFFSRIYRDNLLDRTRQSSAPEIMDFSRFDDADYEIIKKIYNEIEGKQKK